MGIPDHYRRKVWLFVSGCDSLYPDKLSHYNRVISSIFEKPETINNVLWETIEGYVPSSFNINDYYLTEQGNYRKFLGKVF